MLQERNQIFHDILIYWDAPVDEMWIKLPCDTNVSITSGLQREDKPPAAVNVSTFHPSKLSDILVTC